MRMRTKSKKKKPETVKGIKYGRMMQGWGKGVRALRFYAPPPRPTRATPRRLGSSTTDGEVDGADGRMQLLEHVTACGTRKAQCISC